MEELKSMAIRRQIHYLCEFCIAAITDKDLRYEAGLDRESALKELDAITKELEDGGGFTVAFVGEYSSGKTTIVNLLTGTRRQTGTDVTTDESHKLQWNGVWIIDTPGLGSGRREHDSRTEEWLAQADLLVYVVTPDLFGSGSGARFLEMFDKYKREHEMMIVVNMIDKEGNDPAVYEEELQAALGHRPLDDYFPCFISARDKEKSMDASQSADRRERLAQRSRFDTLLGKLDAFVLDRQERASLTTPLTRLQVLMRKMRYSTEYDKEESLLNFRMAALETSLRDVKHSYADFKEEMSYAAICTAGSVFEALGNPPPDFDVFCNSQMEEFSKRCDDCVARLAQRLDGSLELLQEESLSIGDSQLAQEVEVRIDRSEALKGVFECYSTPDTVVASDATMAEVMASIRELAEVSGKSIPNEWASVVHSTNALDAASKLVGMVNRDVVLKVGHILGYKFRPWQAVKLSARLAKAVPLLNLAAAAWEIESHRRDRKKEEGAARQLRQFKIDVKGMLCDSTGKTTQAVYEQLVSNVERVIVRSLEVVKEKKVKLASYAKQYSDDCKALEARRSQCMLLYDDIYGSGTG